MEWVIVWYPRERDVFIDGQRSGRTNQMLIVREGTQTFDLGVPIDYRPQRRRMAVTGTTAATPKQIKFEQNV
jgi:hypothetical protein